MEAEVNSEMVYWHTCDNLCEQRFLVANTYIQLVVFGYFLNSLKLHSLVNLADLFQPAVSKSLHDKKRMRRKDHQFFFIASSSLALSITHNCKTGPFTPLIERKRPWNEQKLKMLKQSLQKYRFQSLNMKIYDVLDAVDVVGAKAPH